MAGHRVVCMDLEELELRDMAKDALRHPDPPKCALCDADSERPLLRCPNCGMVCEACCTGLVCNGCGAKVEEDE